MPVIRLSRTAVDRLTYNGQSVEYVDSRLIGFGVRINAGNKTYFARVQVTLPDGSRKKVNKSVGRVGVVSFEDAEAAARKILEDAARGITPADRVAEARRLVSEDEAKNITVQQVYEGYCKDKKKLKDSTKVAYLKCLEQTMPDWLDLPIREITGAMVLAKHREIGRRAPGQADNAMRILRALCNYTIDIYDDVEIITRNPVRKLSTRDAWYRLERRTGFIMPDDLPAWFDAVQDLDGLSANYLLLQLFTGARSRSEVAPLTWRAFNFAEGTAYFRTTKSGKPLLVPVAGWMMARLQWQKAEMQGGPDDFVFPSFRESATGHTYGYRKQYASVADKSGVTFSPHDLRRTFLSYCEILRVPVFTQKRLCNHALPKDVTQGYIQYSMEELRKVVEEVAWFVVVAAGVVSPWPRRKD
jgi:integrase